MDFKYVPEIISEDENLLVLNKPAGLIVHGDGKNTEPTLSEWLLEKYPNIKGVGENLILTDGREIERPGIVHRIDRWTSGVLLVAKTKKMHSHLKKQFQGRELKKTYKCFVYGHLKDKFGTIDKPLGRSKGDFRQYTTPEKARGEMREAVTYYEVEKEGEFNDSKISYLKVMPKTGRTHQIRAHMVSIGHPIVCDRTYSKKECLLDFERMALHAFSIDFKNIAGEEVHFEAPVPEDFEKALSLAGFK